MERLNSAHLYGIYFCTIHSFELLHIYYQDFFKMATYKNKHVDEDFIVSLLLQSSIKEKNFKLQTSFHNDKKDGFFRSVENVIFTKLIFTINGITGNVKRDTWCENVSYQNGDAVDYYLLTAEVVDTVYSEGIWERDCYVIVEMRISRHKDCWLWQAHNVLAKVLESRHYSS